MKIILQQDVAVLGKRGDVKEVSGGYARNFLLPRGFAVSATEAALKNLEEEMARKEKARRDEEAQYRAAAEALKNMTLRFALKMGERGKAFGSVSAAKIAEAIARQGIAVEKDWIAREDPIKTAGEHVVSVAFPHGIVSKIKILVESE